ncbi:MAG: response regulator [Sphingobium sp.]
MSHSVVTLPEASQARPHDARAARPPRVLIVEDDARQRMLLSRLLIDQGYAVEAVGTAASAVGAMRAAVDLLITDVDLGSRVTGVEIARLARSAQPGLPVIILSARDPVLPEGEDVAYLRKPCASRVILTLVRSLAPLD